MIYLYNICIVFVFVMINLYNICIVFVFLLVHLPKSNISGPRPRASKTCLEEVEERVSRPLNFVVKTYYFVHSPKLQASLFGHHYLVTALKFQRCNQRGSDESPTPTPAVATSPRITSYFGTLFLKTCYFKMLNKILLHLLQSNIFWIPNPFENVKY